MTKQYNYCLDYIKGIACIFVVCMHCEFPGIMGATVQTISRFCVPFFFMVSGYYCYRSVPVSHTDRKRKVGHIFRITVYSSLFYVLFALIRYCICDDVSFSVSKRDVIEFALFNNMKIIVSQMWFLYALLYVYIAYLWFGGAQWYKRYSLVITTVCLFLYVVLAQGLHVVGISAPNFFYRNWMIEGIGFFTLGFSLHIYKKKVRVKNTILFWVIAITTMLSIIERYLLGRDFGVNICSIPQVTALFLYAINNPVRHKGMIQLLGRDCSMMVYILHPAVWHSVEGLYKLIGIMDCITAQYTKPILVVFLTILCAFYFNRVISMVKSRQSIVVNK